MFFGKIPGIHSEDRHIFESFVRSVVEEDPDVCYVDPGDMDNAGHFTGASWNPGEREIPEGKGLNDSENAYSPWLRRGECLDILREADVLFGSFIRHLERWVVYENSVVVVLSVHGMENMKDPKKGYEVIDLREILREHGLLFKEDYMESGGTEINMIWCRSARKIRVIQKILEDYEVRDPELGRVRPLVVVNREEMLKGLDLGKFGKIRPRELYSEKWIENPTPEGHALPGLFVFPLCNSRSWLTAIRSPAA